MHAATPVESENARYLTTFVSLSEVPPIRGPMQLWCGTQKIWIPWPGDCDGSSEASDEQEEVEEEVEGCCDEVERETELTLQVWCPANIFEQMHTHTMWLCTCIKYHCMCIYVSL